MQFENLDSEEIRNHGSLKSVSIDKAEINVLNDINENHVSFGLSFNEDDTLVRLEDFLVFYEILSRTCRIKQQPPPRNNQNIVRQNSNASSLASNQQMTRVVANQSPLLRMHQSSNQHANTRQFHNQTFISNTEMNLHLNQSQSYLQRSSSVNTPSTAADFILNPDSMLNNNRTLLQQGTISRPLPSSHKSSNSPAPSVLTPVPLVNPAIFLANHSSSTLSSSHHNQPNIIINNPTIAVHHHHLHQTNSNFIVQNQMIASLQAQPQQMLSHTRPTSRASSVDLINNQNGNFHGHFNRQQSPVIERLNMVLASSTTTSFNSQSGYAGYAQMHDPYQRITSNLGPPPLARASSASHLNVSNNNNNNNKSNNHMSNIQYNQIQQQQQQQQILNQQHQSHLQNQHQIHHFQQQQQQILASNYLPNPILERINSNFNNSSRSISPQQEVYVTNRNPSVNLSQVNKSNDPHLLRDTSLSGAAALNKSEIIFLLYVLLKVSTILR